MRFLAVTFAAAYLLSAAAPLTLAKHGGGGGGGPDADDGPPYTSTSSTPSTVTTPSSSSSTPLPSGSPSSAAPPAFQFLPPGNTTTCQPTLLRWLAPTTLGADVPLTLTVTNDRAATSPSSSSPSFPSEPAAVLIAHTLTTSVAASANQFTWARVDVPPGTYVLLAADTDSAAARFSAQSPPFFVQPGQDSSCLSAPASSAPDSSSSSPDMSAPSSSSGLSSGSSVTSSPSPSPSTVAPPTSSSPADSNATAPQEKKLSPAVLGGVVAGVVVGIILLVFVFTFPHCWKGLMLHRLKNRRPGGPYYLF